MLRPQCRGGLFENGRSCTIGAALEATGTKYCEHGAAVNHNDFYLHFKERFKCSELMVAHPVNKQLGALMETIYSLNDGYRWTREQIADWVETIEAQHPELCKDSAPVESAKKPEATLA